VRVISPPTVQYDLTDLARGATAALQHLQNWAEEHTSDYDYYRRTHTIDPKP
jgi:DNA-binding HxlR family transcriptional regulator